MSSAKTIRWGIIGVGDVCEVKSGPAFYRASGSQLLAVMRRNLAKAKDFAQRHQVPQYYDNADALLANPDIDAVYIATPPAQHKDYAIAALKAGKHVYIEKPVALNAKECDAIIKAEQQSTKKAVVAHYRRYVPGFLKFSELLAGGAIGRPLMVQVDMLQPIAADIISNSDDNWRVNPALSGGGLFYDLAPHQIDLILQWFGPVVSAQGVSLNQQHNNSSDDLTCGWARLQNDVVLQGRWGFGVQGQQSRDVYEVIGTKGKLSVNFFGSPTIHLENADGNQQICLDNPDHVQQPMIAQVNAYFRGERDNPCSVPEAKAVMALMDVFTQR
ncbi:Gfo/Idh/MocA family oxidoreductase [uncultured Gilvimarinus sp.]|uniref:Gfo/Idh/MocA family protein n=1 Tax=uncultured Gilvimarinus sp. TaxID=1689143 RepID=UPI0030DA16F2